MKRSILCVCLSLVLAISIPLTSCSNAAKEDNTSSVHSNTSNASNVQKSVLSPISSGIYNIRELPLTNDKEWIFGEEGQDGSVQGDNGWYYMYTEETNTNGVYDISKIKECWYSDINDGGSCVSSGNGFNEPTWVAGIYSKDTDIISTGNRWHQSMECMSLNLNPSVESGPLASAVLAFKAPQDGCYRLDISFILGNIDDYDLSGDGVTLSIYENDNMLYNYCASNRMVWDETASVNAVLKAGECFYIIADPNKNGKHDICNNITVKITLTIPEYIDNSNVWAFGDGYINGDGTKQGDNGWYYLYSEETNTGGIYDISKINKCNYINDVQTDYLTGKTTGAWLPKIYDENNKLLNGINQWHQSADGYLSPCMSYPPYASAIIGWKAPENGRYSFNVSLFAGSSSNEYLCDGVDVSVYCGTRKVCGETMKESSYFIYSFEADMEKDVYFYLIVDPKNTALSDVAENVCITVKNIE